MALIRERVQRIMRETIEDGETVIMLDGRQVIARSFIPPSKLAVDYVRSLCMILRQNIASMLWLF